MRQGWKTSPKHFFDGPFTKKRSMAQPEAGEGGIEKARVRGDQIKNTPRIANRVAQIGKSAIHEMTRLSKDMDDVAFLSWAKPTSDTPEHIKEAAIAAIRDGRFTPYRSAGE